MLKIIKYNQSVVSVQLCTRAHTCAGTAIYIIRRARVISHVRSHTDTCRSAVLHDYRQTLDQTS